MYEVPYEWYQCPLEDKYVCTADFSDGVKCVCPKCEEIEEEKDE